MSVCPNEAIEIRHLTHNQLRSQVEGILSIEKESIIAFTAETCGYNAADIAGVSRLKYPTNIKIVKVPCVSRVSVNDILYAFENGAKGVMLVACPEGLCHYINGTEAAEKIIKKARKILDEKGIGGEKLIFVPIVSPDGPKFQKICTELVKEIWRDS